jgi:hypothetical protein
MTKKIITCLLVISLINTLSPFGAVLPAYAAGKVLTLEVVQGPVEYKPIRNASWNVATGIVDLDIDYNVNVGPGGTALLHYPDGSTTRLFEKSMAEVISINDVGGVRDYNIRFIGQIITSPKEAKEENANFLSNAPAVMIHSRVEYMAELKPDMSLDVTATQGEVPEEISINPGYNVRGTVHEIFPHAQVFTLDIDKDNIAVVEMHPHTVIKNGYGKYRDSGKPGDLGKVEDLEEGEDVIVFGENPIVLHTSMEVNTEAGTGSSNAIMVSSDGKKISKIEDEEIQEIEAGGFTIKAHIPRGKHIIYIITPLATNEHLLPAALGTLRIGGMVATTLGKGALLTGVITTGTSISSILIPIGLTGIIIPLVTGGSSTPTGGRTPGSPVQPI